MFAKRQVIIGSYRIKLTVTNKKLCTKGKAKSFFLSFSYQEFIIHHIVLHILLFYCSFLMLSEFDQLTKWSLILRLKNQFIWNASYIGKLYYRICLQNRIKVKIHAKNCLTSCWYLKWDFMAAGWVWKILSDELAPE